MAESGAVPGGEARSLARARWALLFGNFVIACGVMAPAGTMNDLTRSLQVSVSLAGHLIAIGAAFDNVIAFIRNEAANIVNPEALKVLR